MASGHTTVLGDWLERLNAEDPEAREALIEHTCERLRNMTRTMLRASPKVRRWAETDDLLQDALIRLHRSLAELRPSTAKEFYGLAAMQLRRQLIDLARSYYGPEGIGKNHLTDHGKIVSARAASPPDTLEEWTEFHEQIDHLPAEEKDVVLLLWYEGLTRAEAAKVLSISLATVKRRWQSARMLLSARMQGEWPND